MEYITFMRKNSTSPIQDNEWTAFFERLHSCDEFRGGSAIEHIRLLGDEAIEPVSDQLGGFMRFDFNDMEDLNAILAKHPIIIHGGSIEVCEMPTSE